MNAVVLLFVVGILLVAIEIVVPGVVVGICGGLCLLVGVITAFVQLGTFEGLIATGVAILVVALTIYLEFVLLPRTALAKKFSMAGTVAGRSQPEVADRAAVLGREAVAVTTLAPSGYVELDGRRYEAFCQFGHTAVGARLRVVDLDNFRLVVTPIK